MDLPTLLTVFSVSGIGGVLEYLSLEGAAHDQEEIFKELHGEMKNVLGADHDGARSGSIFEFTELADRLKRK
jgi:hypothetical protein